MLELFISPSKYISGYDNLGELGSEVFKLGKKSLVLVDKKTDILAKKGIDSLEENNIKVEKIYFEGECSFDEIKRLTNIAIEKNVDNIVGFGGGKLIDTVKAVGYDADIKIITVPTVAATCAAWSSHSAVYTPDGISETYYAIYKNPDLLFFDKKLNGEAPVRYTIAGMVDTLAKWIETRAFTSGIKEKNTELEIAIYLAKKCYEEILEYGQQAIEDMKNKKYSEAVDKILEHNILTAGLVGGIGGEACRAVAAHAINNGLTVIPRLYFGNLHGETVGFGNLVQLILDGHKEEAVKIAKFYKAIGAPVKLEDLGFGNLDSVTLDKIVQKAMYKGDTMWNLPYEFNFDIIKNTILEANSLLD